MRFTATVASHCSRPNSSTRGQRADAGAVDEDVERAEPVDAGGDDLGRRARLGDVRLQELVAAAALLDERAGLAVVVDEAGHEEVGAGRGEREGERLAETRVAAGDDGVLPLEGEVVHREVGDVRHGSLLRRLSGALGPAVFDRMFVKSSRPENIVSPGGDQLHFCGTGRVTVGLRRTRWATCLLRRRPVPTVTGFELIRARARRGTRARAGPCPRRPRALDHHRRLRAAAVHGPARARTAAR